MRQQLLTSGLEKEIEVDSAGTINFHTGNPPDSRMTAAARDRGIEMTGKARQITKNDLAEFDLILVADRENLADVEKLASNVEAPCPIRLFCEFCTEHDQEEVPDPYYGGPAGFELVLDLLEDGCNEIIRRYQADKLV